MHTTKLDVFTLVLVLTYFFLAPTQVLELPVSMMRSSIRVCKRHGKTGDRRTYSTWGVCQRQR
jgi:hypothetical protein